MPEPYKILAGTFPDQGFFFCDRADDKVRNGRLRAWGHCEEELVVLAAGEGQGGCVPALLGAHPEQLGGKRDVLRTHRRPDS